MKDSQVEKKNRKHFMNVVTGQSTERKVSYAFIDGENGKTKFS